MRGNQAIWLVRWKIHYLDRHLLSETNKRLVGEVGKMGRRYRLGETTITFWTALLLNTLALFPYDFLKCYGHRACSLGNAHRLYIPVLFYTFQQTLILDLGNKIHYSPVYPSLFNFLATCKSDFSRCVISQLNHNCENRRISRKKKTIYRKIYRVKNPKLLVVASKQNRLNAKE